MNSRWALFLVLIAAGLILSIHLGTAPLWGSEGRWAVIARYMYRSGDVFTPMLDSAAYSDKPLLSYWQVLPFAWIRGGVDECAARLPSAAWALVLLALTYDLARKWFDRRTALISAAVLLTSEGFVLWGRNAQVEMTSAALVTLCIWYFLAHRRDERHGWVYVLGVIMGLGSNMKGLLIYTVPLFSIALLSLVKRDWRWLPPARTILAAGVVSLFSFLLVPLVACLYGSSWELLRMVWQENVVRFFKPFDHIEPFYVYGYSIFVLAAPWCLLLPVSIGRDFVTRRFKDPAVSEVMILAGGIFLFFTLSGSRRPYYLLPILPFVSIMTGDLLTRFAHGELSRAWSRLTTACGILIGAVCLVPLAAYPSLCVLRGLPDYIHNLLPAGVIVALAGLIMAISAVRKSAAGMLAAAAVVWLLYVSVVVPWAAAQPNNIRELVAKVKALNKPVALLRVDSARIDFYLDGPHTSFVRLDDALQWTRQHDGVLITSEPVSDSGFAVLTSTHRFHVVTAKAAPADHGTNLGNGIDRRPWIPPADIGSRP